MLEYFRNEEKRHEYYEFFKKISDIYDILSPDRFLRSYIEDFEILARMYEILKEAYEPGISIGKEFSRKTAKLVQEYTKSSKIKSGLEVYEINENTLRKIEESKTSDTEKVFNLLKSIEKTIKDNVSRTPYLISIGEKAELIARRYKERQKNTQETLEELKKLIQEINSARKEEIKKNMPVEIFTVYWVLRNEAVDKSEDKTNQMRAILAKYPHWRKSESHEREIKEELCAILVQSGLKNESKIVEIAQNVIRLLKGSAE